MKNSNVHIEKQHCVYVSLICLFVSIYSQNLIIDPDKNPDPEAAAQFQAVDKAYKILSDPKLRSTYDQLGPRGFYLELNVLPLFIFFF